MDGNYQYSPVEATSSDCESQMIKVYPTLTKGVVHVGLPSGYEKAQIEVYNTLGQLLQLPNTNTTNNIGVRSIHLQGLAQGQYVVKVINGSEISTFKVIYQP